MKYKRVSHAISHWLLVCLFSFSLQPFALAVNVRPLVLQAVRVAEDEDALLVSLELDGIAAFTQSTLPNPARIVVDIRNAVQTIRPLSRADEQIVIPIGDSGIARARLGQMGNNVRVVFDVAKLGRYQVERQGTNLVVRFPRAARAALKQAWKTPAAQPPAQKMEVAAPVVTATATKPEAAPVIPVADKPVNAVAPAASAAPPRPMPELKLEEKNISSKDGKKNFSTGMKYEAQQRWDVAAQHFIVAAAAEPNNPEYQLHLLRAKQNAAIMLAGRGDALAEQRDYAGAWRAYRQAAAYDDTNELVRVKMTRLAEQPPSGAPNYNARTGNVIAVSADIAMPQRAPSNDLLQVIHFEDVKLRQVIERCATDLGLNVIFDETFKDEPKFRFKAQNITLARAFDMILVQTRHLFEQMDRRTILIYADNPANRQRYEQLLVKTFYLGSADANDVKATLHQMIGPQRQIAVIKQLNALIVRDTVANLKMVQEMIDSIDKNRAEVVVDVDIYEVSRSTSLEIGNQLALSSQPVTQTRFDTSGNPVTVTTGGSAALGNLGGVGRAGLAAIAGNTVAPVLGGVGTLIGLPPSSLSLLQSKGHSKLLASTQIHALDGEQNQTKVGRSVPIRLGSTFVPGIASAGAAGAAGGGLGGGAFDSIQYRDVGLVIDVTPTVSNEGYVQLRMKLESTNVEASGADLTLTPSFTQRSLSTIARVVDNKTAVVAGIKQESKGESRAGLPVLSMIPLLGRFLTTPRQSGNLSDIVITVTPHILRAPELKKQDHLAKLSGTFIAGVTQSVEDVAQRAQTEDDQERRITNRQSLIAKGKSDERNESDTAANEATAPTTPAVAVSLPATANTTEAVPVAAKAAVPVDLSLIPATIEAESGASFFVVASVYGDAKLNEAKLGISFDPVLLQFKGVRSGGLFGRDPNITTQLNDGTLQIRIRQTEDKEAPIAASGQLVLLEFVARQEGETFLTFQRDTTELRLGRNAVRFTPSNAHVHIGKEGGANSSNK
ncbi:MAG: secretin N-terminal domain-containing protein [Blastocatellia bacterium]